MTKTKGKADAADVFTGQRLRAVRTALGWSQEKLAAAIKVTFQQVQKYESGANRITVNRFFDICRALDVSPVNFMPDDVKQLVHRAAGVDGNGN